MMWLVRAFWGMIQRSKRFEFRDYCTCRHNFNSAPSQVRWSGPSVSTAASNTTKIGNVTDNSPPLWNAHSLFRTFYQW